MPSQLLFFDSSTATYLNDPNNTTGITSNSFKCQYAMNQQFKKIRKVWLKSLELPAYFTNIRKGSTDTLKFTLNGTTYTVTLAEKNYTTIASLITDLNTACVGVVSGVTITFSQTSSLTTPYRLLITFTGTVTSFTMIDTNLSKYILGFRGAQDTLVGSVYNATVSNYDLNADAYFYLYIPSLNAMNASMNGASSTFKIPMTQTTNQTQYYFDNIYFQQFVEITDRNFVLSSLTCIILDRYGNNLQANGLDWSMSLQIDYEI